VNAEIALAIQSIGVLVLIAALVIGRNEVKRTRRDAATAYRNGWSEGRILKLHEAFIIDGIPVAITEITRTNTLFGDTIEFAGRDIESTHRATHETWLDTSPDPRQPGTWTPPDTTP